MGYKMNIKKYIKCFKDNYPSVSETINEELPTILFKRIRSLIITHRLIMINNKPPTLDGLKVKNLQLYLRHWIVGTLNISDSSFVKCHNSVLYNSSSTISNEVINKILAIDTENGPFITTLRTLLMCNDITEVQYKHHLHSSVKLDEQFNNGAILPFKESGIKIAKYPILDEDLPYVLEKRVYFESNYSHLYAL